MGPIVAVLETMWGYRTGRAPRYFKINPLNASGRRLYKLVGEQNKERLLLTNVCRELVTKAKHHGKPDPDWLAENLIRLDPDIILVCGRVAQKTFKECGYVPLRKPIYMLHPAARNWTKARLREVQRKIQK
jgi:hypothetical protein